MFSNVLVALKEGLDPEPLLDLARKAAAPGARVHLVTLVRATTQDGPKRLRQVEASLGAATEGLTEEGFAATFEVNVVVTAAALDLARIAEEQQSDLMVIGLAKRSRVGKALLGSDAQRVLLSSRCPVLVSRIPS